MRAKITGRRGHADDREEAIAQIYQRHAPQIAAYARRRAAPEEAADVVSETFLVAWRRYDEIPVEPNTLPWLYGVARLVLSNQRRSTRRRGRLWERLNNQAAIDHTPPCPIENRGEYQVVGRALSELSDEDAEILRLIAWEGLSPAQVAPILGIEPNAARQRLHRARLRLRKRIDALSPVADRSAPEHTLDGHTLDGHTLDEIPPLDRLAVRSTSEVRS